MNKFNRIMPRKGSVETILDRLYEYINPVNPIWIKNIKSASYEDIEKLEDICGLKNVGLKIPKSYLEFLNKMGTSDGGLLSKVIGGNRNIKIILDLYEDIISYDKNEDILYCEGDDIEINSYKLYIALTVLDVEYYFKFNNDSTYIITCDYDESYKIPPISNNFEKLLFISAYKNYENKYYENELIYTSTPENYQKQLKKLGVDDIFTVLDSYLIKNNFNKAWFSDKYNLIAYKENISFVLYKSDILYGQIYGNNELKMKKIAEELCTTIGTRIVEKNLKVIKPK